MVDPAVAPKPAYKNDDTAPFVYFDVVPTYGIMGGTIQIELAARTLTPNPNGPPITEFVATGRLRCSLAAANQLREAIDKTIKMLMDAQAEQHSEPAAAAKLN
jgi:hypothetical protein